MNTQPKQYPAYVDRTGKTQVPFRALMRAEKQHNQPAPKVQEARPARQAAPKAGGKERKERDYAMMETWLKQNRPGYRLRAALQREPVDLLAETAPQRYDAEAVKEAVAEDPSLDVKAGCGTNISAAMMRAMKYEDVRKALPMLEEVPFGKWVAGEAPLKAAIIADHAMRDPIEEVLLFVATVLAFASMPKDRVETPAFTPSRSSQSSPERAELPHKAAMRRKSGKAFQLKARKTEELKADFWSLLSKKRGHYAEVRLAKIDAEFQRRGVDVFHSKN